MGKECYDGTAPAVRFDRVASRRRCDLEMGESRVDNKLTKLSIGDSGQRLSARPVQRERWLEAWCQNMLEWRANLGLRQERSRRWGRRQEEQLLLFDTGEFRWSFVFWHEAVVVYSTR